MGIQRKLALVILFFGAVIIMVLMQYSMNQGKFLHSERERFAEAGLMTTANSLRFINATALPDLVLMQSSDKRMKYAFNTALCGHKETMNDLLCMEPPSYLDNFKNPCWKSTTQKLRCYPYFQLIGMDKSGSSDLFERISKHPDVYGNKGTLGKETQWWPWKKYGYFMMHNIRKETFSQYLNYFDKSAIEIESKKDNSDYHYGIVETLRHLEMFKPGFSSDPSYFVKLHPLKLCHLAIQNVHPAEGRCDGTPMDAWDFTGWPQIPQNFGLKEPMFVTPHLIRHISPNTKFITIMRDPIERLYSDYFFIGLGGTTPNAFHSAVVNSVKYLEDCMKLKSIRFCLYDRNMHLKWNRQARIHLGFYYIFLAEWINVFPRKQFLFLRTEDYSSNIADTLNKCFNFLQARPLSATEITNYGIDIQKRKHTTKRKSKSPMFNKTREILQKLYEPFNQKLAKLLHDDIYLWKS